MRCREFKTDTLDLLKSGGGAAVTPKLGMLAALQSLHLWSKELGNTRLVLFTDSESVGVRGSFLKGSPKTEHVTACSVSLRFWTKPQRVEFGKRGCHLRAILQTFFHESWWKRCSGLNSPKSPTKESINWSARSWGRSAASRQSKKKRRNNFIGFSTHLSKRYLTQ